MVCSRAASDVSPAIDYVDGAASSNLVGHHAHGWPGTSRAMAAGAGRYFWGVM